MQNQTSPLILTFGLSDPVGAVGTSADLATFAAFACHGLSITTGLLIADSARIEDSSEIDADWVADQARVVLEDMQVAAFKVGAISAIEQVTAIAEIVSDYPDVPLVFDPFLSSLPDSGLSDDDMLMAVRQILIPQTTVLMLSQVELARMAETWRESGDDDLLEADVMELIEMGCEYVLVTGNGSNTLYREDGVVASHAWQHLPGSFVGAGSTLSGAICALMAQGLDAPEAVQAAHDYTAGALAHAQRFGMGKLVPNKFFQSLTSE